MRILVVDDHPIVRQGISHLLTAQIKGVQIREADCIDAAIREADETPPDVAVVDLSLGREFGLDLIRKLKCERPQIRILVLSVFDENLHAERALRAGARGYVMKELAPDELVDSVLRVARGEIVVSTQLQSRMLTTAAGGGAESRTGEASLSPREMEVLQLISQGLSTQQIAERIFRSAKTIEAHRANIQRKLNLDCSSQLVRYAALWAEHGSTDKGNP